MKRRILALSLALLLALTATGCGSGSAAPQPEKKPVETEQKDIPKAASVPIPAETETPVVLQDAGALGTYDVQIGGFELITDYDGAPAILVEFAFTNNSEENASAMINLSYTAYQNGIELDSAFVIDSNIYNGEDLMKEIQPGASLTVKVPFALNSESAPVEFEISESFSFDDVKLGKTFEIQEGGVTVLSTAPNADTAEQLGDYAVSILSYSLTTDYNGKPAVMVNFGFTNNSDTATSMAIALSYKAFQDGVQLETAIVNEDGIGSSQIRNVRPGAGMAVSAAYLLSSDTSPVHIEIEETFSFSGDKVTGDIDLTQ